MKKIAIVFMFVAFMVSMFGISDNAYAGEKPKYRVAWSIYAGWMPWPYADESGILKKWADANGVEIELLQMDYIPSLEAYVAGKVDAVVATNMETLDMPASAGVDSTIVIMGDFSNGNDALCTVGLPAVTDLRGQSVSLVELSVSHYLLARALEMNGMSEEDVTLVNTSDADIAGAFLADDAESKAMVTWNPMVMQVMQAPGVKSVFTSEQIPGEIMDLMVVRTDVLKKSPALGRALVGAWYEVMGVMSQRGASADAALTSMATKSGCNLAEYKSQLRTTAMFYTPQSALDYMSGNEIREKMEFVRKFCFKHGLLGENARSADVVGVAYPDGTVQGDPNNVKMRFDTSFTKLAAEGQLTR